jgi:hypothetical protein
MYRIIRKAALIAVVGAGIWVTSSLFAAPGSSSGNPAAPSYKPEQEIVLKEQGKPDRKCLIISTKIEKGGVMRQKVKALDNGEILTLDVRPPQGQPVLALPPTVAVIPANPPAPAKLTANAAEAAQPLPPKPVSKSLWTRLFGPSTPSSCAPCQKGNPVPLIKPQPTTVKPNVTSTAPPPLAEPMRVAGLVPLPAPIAAPAIIPEPVVAELEPNKLTETIRPLGPLPKYGAIQQDNDDDRKIAHFKIALKGALRPSEREMAAEGLMESYQGKSPEIRTLLQLAAKEDPAATVRLTCLRCLYRQGINDEALIAALGTAKHDRDPRVREEAESLEKRSMKK